MEKFRFRSAIRFLIKSSGILALGTTLGGIVFLNTTIPEKIFQHYLQFNLSKRTKQHVTLEKVSGNFLSELSLKGLKIVNPNDKNPIFEANEIEFSYSVLDIILSLGYVPNAVKKITIRNGNFYIERDKKGNWCLKDFGDNQESKFLKKFPEFEGEIRLENFTLHYKDERGWAATPLKTPFYETIDNLNGSIQFQNKKPANLVLKGALTSTKAPVILKGFLYPDTIQYDIDFTIAKMNVDQWGPYVLPFSGFHLTKNTASLQGNVRTKTSGAAEQIPFWYDLQFTTTASELKIPYLELPITQISGKTNIFYGTLSPTLIQESIPNINQNEAKDLFKILIQKNVIKDNGQILSQQPKKLTFPSKWTPFRESIFAMLKHPIEKTEFLKTKAYLGDLSAQIHGQIRMNHQPHITLIIQNSNFDIHNFPSAFSVLTNWPLTGNGPAILNIKGPLESPKITGSFQSKLSKITGLLIQDVQTNFEIKNNQLLFNFPKFTYMSNPWSGNGSVNFANASLSLNFLSKNFALQSFQPLKNYAQGNTELSVSIHGVAPSLDIKISGNTNNAKLFKQSFTKLNVTLKTKSNPPYFLQGKIDGNKKDESITILGKITHENTLILNLKTENYPIMDPYSSDQKLPPGKLSATATLTIDDDVSADFDGTCTNVPFNGKIYTNIQSAASYKNGIWTINSLEAKNESESLSLKGEFNNHGPIKAQITAKNIQTSQEWVQAYIPEKYKPIGGLLNASFEIKQTNLDDPLYIKGKGSIQNGTILGQSFQNLSSEFEFTNNTLNLLSMTIAQDVSKVFINGTINSQKLNLNILDNSQIDLDEFSTLVLPYGNFRGIIQGKAHISGSLYSPKIDASFKTLNFQTEHQAFDKIEGRIQYDSPYLKISSLSIESNQNCYVLQGQWNLKSLPKKINDALSAYMFKLTIEKGDVPTFISILNTLYSDFKSKENLENVQPEKITNPNITISAQDEKGNILLFEQGNPQNVLELFYQKTHKKSSGDVHSKAKWMSDINGKLQGEFSIIGNPDSIPILNAHLAISEFEYKKFNTNLLEITVTPETNRSTYLIQCQKGNLANIPFSSITSSGGVDINGNLHISNLEIASEIFSKQSIISGDFPLSPYWNIETLHQNPINLHLSLEGNQVTLLSLFLPGVQDITNDGNISCTISGPLDNPQFNSSEISIKNASIRFEPKHLIFNEPVQIPTASIQIQNNTLAINSVSFMWEEQTNFSSYLKNTNRIQNQVDLYGSITLKKFNLLNPNTLLLDLNLSLKPTTLTLLNDAIKGSIQIKSFVFTGPYTIPFSEKSQNEIIAKIKNKEENGPKLNCDIALKDTILSFTNKSGSGYLPMIELNLNTQIQKNVEINGNILGNSLLAGISTHLEFMEKETPLKITGTLNHPVLNDTLFIKNGTIDLFNRSFKLLNAQEQKRYQPPGQTNQQTNSITFSNYHNINGLSPIFNFCAATVIEKNQPLTTNITTVQDSPFTHIVLIIDGPSDALKEFRFDVFDGTAPQTFTGSLVYKTTYFIPTNITESQTSQRESDTRHIIELLLPELFLADQSPSEELLSQYTENRINMLVKQEILRPIEKQISNRVGLYDLRIDYNLGSDIFRRNDTTHREVGIDAIQKIVSDQLFLRVRTDIDLESDRQKTRDAIGVSEIELTYYLLKNRNMSINYANIKDPNIRSDYHPKLSLRFSHEF